MNKVILMGRLTRDPEVRYTQGEKPLAIARYSLAVNRRFKRDGQPDVDFINVVAFGRDGEFVEKYLKKGMQMTIVGRIQTGSYTDKEGNKKYTTEVIVEEHHFAESKRSFEERVSGGESAPSANNSSKESTGGFVPVDDFEDDDLPF